MLASAPAAQPAFNFTQQSSHHQPAPQPTSHFVAAQQLLPRLLKGTTIDQKSLRAAMEHAFDGSDSEGAWSWKDAYDAVEAGLILFLKKYGPAILKQPPEQAIAMLEKLQSLTPTHTRRSEESQTLQQFSTPLTLSYLVAYAAQINRADTVLEPSAGTGMLAVYGDLQARSLVHNEYGNDRAALLASLFKRSPVTRHNAEQIDDYLNAAHSPDVVLMNPPFSTSPGVKGTKRHVTAWHIASALARLKDGGRLVAITGRGFAATENRWREPFKRLQTTCRVVFSAAIDGGVYKKHGTTAATRLTVFDKVPAEDPADVSAYKGTAQTAADLLALLQTHLPNRVPTQTPTPAAVQGELIDVSHLQVAPAKTPKAKPARKASRAKLKTETSFSAPVDLAYETRDWSPSEEILTEALYETYEPQSVVVKDAQPHPTKLVQSAAMASVPGPKASYVPTLSETIVTGGILSDAQLESIIYAGNAHDGHLSGHFTVSESYEEITRASEDDPDAVQFRRGWSLGDGTGCGKGRQVAGIILDNWMKGRKRSVWISKSDKLLEDARRDWSALGGAETQVIPLAKFKQGAEIPIEEGILFVTYGTLRTGARQHGVIKNEDGSETPIVKKSRVDQIVDWLGDDFDGVIAFDESHAMANAASKKGSRGETKASLQGLAGLRLQYGLPDARVVYVSATGATEVSGLAYATRLGLWGTDDFPFNTRTEFIKQMEAGGVAAMEMISRDLKALGLYTARSLSYEGIEYDALTHALTAEQIRIYNEYADAFKIIHNNIERALEATNITADGSALNANAKGAARSAFESTKQRFFNHLLTAMKCPSLIKAIEADMERGDAVVVQIVSTCEALLDRRLADIPAEEWQDITVDVTPREYVLCRYPHNTYYAEQRIMLRSVCSALVFVH